MAPEALAADMALAALAADEVAAEFDAALEPVAVDRVVLVAGSRNGWMHEE